MIMMFNYFFLAITASCAIRASIVSEVFKLAQQASKPNYYLKKQGPLVQLGTASLDQAQIILLPEVHDDKDILLSQFLLLAREKKLGSNFIVLDESLKAMKQSTWELFSEKALEVIAADHKNQDYSVKGFEKSLQNLATQLRQKSDMLSYVTKPGMWVLKPFSSLSMKFFGWDLAKRESLYDRNLELVKTLKKLVPHYQRIFVLLGARHVPELEYLISKHLLCLSSQSTNVKDFFVSLSNTNSLPHSIGSSAPIYQFLADQSYAVVFNKNLYPVLKHIAEDFGQKKVQCVNIKKDRE